MDVAWISVEASIALTRLSAQVCTFYKYRKTTEESTHNSKSTHSHTGNNINMTTLKTKLIEL